MKRHLCSKRSFLQCFSYKKITKLLPKEGWGDMGGFGSMGPSPKTTSTHYPGALLTYFNDRGMKNFLGQKFWPKGIFLGL